jgi:hypothetical protein
MRPVEGFRKAAYSAIAPTDPCSLLFLCPFWLCSEDLSALSSALAEAEAAGMGGCAQAVALTEQKRVLEHEAAVVRDLRAALQKADLEVIQHCQDWFPCCTTHAPFVHLPACCGVGLMAPVPMPVSASVCVVGRS